ncbi:hypothetical protein HAX54_043504 [Datura stramonium]|uniref:Uncharacterized protein n=1 Tax=Datura stramonium TaxID=4076 RepID=A0ABS8SN69_DATST|nr:hypothetical protein [Datura stramonium]
MASKWKPKENGAIPCPPKDMGGCSKGTLNLRCIFSENWISQLLLKAKEIAQKCKLKEMNYESELHYSCSKYKGENDTSGGKLRKAAARENSDDNYVFCPAAVDTRRANLRHFRLYLSKGEPVVVTNVIWAIGIELGTYGSFDERLPRHGAEFSSCLPFMEYTHPQYGYLNLALRLPDSCSKPDLGPKAYIAAVAFLWSLRQTQSPNYNYAVTDTKQNCDGLKVENSSKAENKIGLKDLKKQMVVPSEVDVVHPILDETFNFTDHKRRLKEEYGIGTVWVLVQKLGEAVLFLLDALINPVSTPLLILFPPPENVNECIRLTEEFLQASQKS